VNDADAIAAIVGHINESWRAQRYDDIGSHLAVDVVMAAPGSTVRLAGRDAYVQSYREYDRAAVTETFTPGEPQIDVIGDVAVATCPFSIVYRLEGTTYRERGQDILVLHRQPAGWRVVWRSMHTEPAP
jgi:ketosteroid isomerase-like protein